jgi:lipoprotein-releasing system permease protein
MINNFSFYLALRYLRPKRTFVSVITVISVLGVLFGVAILVVVISVMAGFQEQIKDLASKFESHILAFDHFGTSMMAEKRRPKDVQEKGWREVVADLRRSPDVKLATPMIKSFALIEGAKNVEPVLMWGMEPEEGDRLLTKYKDMLKRGKLDLKSENPVVLDERLANQWGLDIGDKVTLYAPSNLKAIFSKIHELDDKPESEKQQAIKELKELTAPLDLTVVATISPPVLQDGTNRIPLAIVPLYVAQEVLDVPDTISSIGIEVEDPYQADAIEKKLVENGTLPEPWQGVTWREMHQNLFDTVQNELEMMYFVLFFIVIVAAFCVMNTMITVTVQKRREIGIISALGSRIGQIMWVFLVQGMIVGIIGAFAGLGVGLLVVHYRNEIRALIAALTGHEIFDSSIYGLIKIPAKVVPMDLAIIGVGAFLLCTVASLIPAFLAARTEPAEALRD